MILYRLQLQPDILQSFHVGAAPLTKDSLEQLAHGAIVHSIDAAGFGFPATIVLQVDAEPSHQALNVIATAVQRCGYQIVEGEVVKWVDAQVQGALLGLLGGAGGGALTKNEGLAMLLAVAGAVCGQVAGAQVRKHEVIYRITRAYVGAPIELVPVNDAKGPAITLTDWIVPGRT